MNRAFLGLVTWAAFGVGVLSVERGLRVPAPLSLLGGALSAGALWAVVLLGRRGAARGLDAVVDRFERVSEPAWLAGCVGLAAALRVAWAALLTPVQVSDMAIYVELARSLAERGTFQYGADRIYMPPGLPLVLAPGVKILGAATYLPLALNVLLAAGTILVVAALSRLLADGRVLRLSTLLVAVWPNLVLLSGLASKELVVLFLLPLATLLYLRATGACGGRPAATGLLGAGLAFGAATLTQPNTLVLLPAFAGLEAFRRAPVREVVVRLGLFAAGAILVVSPWTVRNALLFGRFVPVSANFGHSVFVGNHPGADGRYQPLRDAYVGMDEIEYDRMALRKGLAWISANPGEFLALIPRKQMLFLGDDADGAYHALKWAHGIGDLRYAAAKAASNLFWVGVLALVGVSLHGRRDDPALLDSRLALLTLPWFCLLVLLSVTESGARHHVALAGFLALLASLAVLSPQSTSPVSGGRQS